MVPIGSDLRHLVENYITWLRERIKLAEIPHSGGWMELTTPFLDRHNDFLQIYVQPTTDGKFILSDDGYTIAELERSGCLINTPKRKEIFQEALRAFGLTEDGGELQTTSTESNFPLKKHLFLQGMLAIGDMFYMAAPTVASLFREDVEAWLDAQGVRFISVVKLTGKSGYDHVFDFAIPKSKSAPERVMKTFARPSRESAEAMAFSWIDTREVRSPESKAYAVLNDQDSPVSANVLDALRVYEVTPILWSDRDRHREALAA
jgi:Domain of unknown function DUF1829/Domain of unknown function DUF1828